MKRALEIRPSTLYFILIAIITAIGFHYFPWISDDLYYRVPFAHYYRDGEPVTFSQLFDHFVWRHNHDNSRLATLMMIFIQFLPEWLLASFSGLALLGLLFFGFRLTGCRSLPAAVLWSMFIIFFMPWADNGYVFDFQIPYLWGTTMGLILMLYFLKPGGHTVLLSLFALILGAWQEAIGFPVFTGVTVVTLLLPKYRNPKSYAICLSLLAGLGWLYLSPGGRTYRAVVFEVPVYMWAIFIIPFLIGGLWTAVSLWRCRDNVSSRFQNPALILFILISGAASAAVSALYHAGPRLSWWCAAMGWILIMMQLRHLRPRLHKAAIYTATMAIIAATFVHLFIVDHICLSLHGSVENAKEQMKTPACPRYIFIPTLLSNDFPVMTLLKPGSSPLTRLPYKELFCQLFNRTGHDVSVLPARLRDFRPCDAVPIEGSGGKLMMYNGLIVGLDGDDTECTEALFVDFGHGESSRDYFRYPFPDADGHLRNVYLRDGSYLDKILGRKIVAARR